MRLHKRQTNVIQTGTRRFRSLSLYIHIYTQYTAMQTNGLEAEAVTNLSTLSPVTSSSCLSNSSTSSLYRINFLQEIDKIARIGARKLTAANDSNRSIREEMQGLTKTLSLLFSFTLFIISLFCYSLLFSWQFVENCLKQWVPPNDRELIMRAR